MSNPIQTDGQLGPTSDAQLPKLIAPPTVATELGTLVHWIELAHEALRFESADWDRAEQFLAALKSTAADSDDEFTPPTASAIEKLRSTIVALRGQQIRRPDAILPDGAGGICFEWKLGQNRFAIESKDSGELQVFRYDATLKKATSIPV